MIAQSGKHWLKRNGKPILLPNGMEIAMLRKKKVIKILTKL